MEQRPVSNACRKKAIYIFIVLIVFICTIYWPSYTFATSQGKTVKVGYIEGYGVTTINKELRQGYIYDYLMEIAKYTKWQYEFIPVTLKEGLDKLTTGELDLFGPLEYTDERGKQFAFPEHDFGYEYGTLMTSSENEYLFYNDFESFNGIKIGHISSCNFISEFKKYAINQDFSVEYVHYADTDTLEEGLRTGQVDAILVGSFSSDIDNMKVIGKYSINPTYMAVPKGKTDLLNELNEALSNIKIEDVYIDYKLNNKYLKYNSEHLAFTREEHDYISSHPKLRVVYDPDYAPIGYYDKKTKKYRGISAEVMKLISEISGIEFEYIKTKNYEESVQYIKEGKADLLAGFTDHVDSEAFLETKKYIDIPAIVMGKAGSNINNGYKIALPVGYKSSINYIKEKYDDAEIILYNSFKACIDALNQGKVDATIINSYMYANIIRDSHNDSYRMIDVSEAMLSLKVGVSKQVDPRVLPILNKSITNITGKQLDEIVFTNTVGKAHKMPWQKVVKQYSFYLIGAISLLFLVIVTFVIINHKRTKRKLEKIAYTDTLTGVRNLEKFRLDAAVLFEKNKPEDYSMLYLDVEKFKNINDTYGFKAGNDALIHITKSFIKELTEEDLFGRGSADYFLILMKERDSLELFKRIQVILKRIQTYGENQSNPFKLTMRCGVYEIMPNETNITSLIDKANEARKGLKQDIGKTFAYYTTDMHKRILKEKLIEESMEQALVNEDFLVYLQPKYGLSKHGIAGAEALVRWNHSKAGMISPAEFIPVFEKNGFIISLDFYVFEKVCQKIKEWIRLDYHLVPISVNISRVHLNKKDFISRLVQLVKKYDIPPHLIELELTESTFTENIDLLIKIMKELKEAGFKISVDDFGTGFSSLNLLKVLPVDVLKLDKSFLDREETTAKEEILIADVVRMAHHLDIKVVAEGVERMKQVAFLKSINCDLVQGYVFAKPMPIQDFENLAFKTKV
ncbi:EAL domain-containing protein [Bacillus sp. JJ722]|uniref:EAL domain-containing protein n=1 Tax=Bacillus sp. JJ722 TaxID=3122973 RepID=UPI003000C194